MSQSSHVPLVRATSRNSVHTNTYTNTNSDVLTADLLRGTSLYQVPLQEPETPGQNSSVYSASVADNTYTSYASHALGPAGQTNTTLVVSRGSTPQRSVPPSAATPVYENGTESSISMVQSLPYYDLSNYSRSLNTLNLLQSDESAPLASARDSEPSVGRSSDHFNQVPPRFSQFITNQNLPVPAPSSTHSHAHSREISCSMGSQATIFSTRSDDGIRRRRPVRSSRGVESSSESSSLLERRKAIRFRQGGRMYRLRLALRKMAAKIRQKMGKWRSFLVGSKRATSNVKTASDRPFLSRQRSKKAETRGKGMKNAQISAPLANPNLEYGTGASRVEGLTEELKAQAGAAVEGEKVHKKTPGNIQGIPRASAHLAQYIAEQRHLSHHRLASDSARSESSIAPPPPPHTDTSFKRDFSRTPENDSLQGIWKSYLSNVLASRIKLRQEVHLFQLLLANQPIPSVFNNRTVTESPRCNASIDNENAKSSRRWSESMAEIKSHRASIVPGKYSSTESEVDSFRLYAASSLAPTAPSESPSHFSHLKNYEGHVTRPEAHSAETAIETAPETREGYFAETDEESADERIERLQQVLNRRSMLGEMLDYDSDDLSSASSTFSRPSVEESLQHSQSSRQKAAQSVDTHLVKRYGTLKRRPTDKSSYYGSSNGSSQYPANSSSDTKSMSRSPGYNDLQMATSLAEEV